MSDPLEPAIPFESLPRGHRLYLMACPTPADPTMTWGTDVAFEPLQEAVEELNRGEDGVVVTPLAFIVKAVERCLEEHPDVNARIVGGRIHRYARRHVHVSIQRRDGEAGVISLRDLDGKTVPEVARTMWEKLMEDRDRSSRGSRIGALLQRTGLGRRILRAGIRMGTRSTRDPERVGAAILVNFMGGADLPPMRAFHPSRFPLDHLLTTITVGRPEPRPVAIDGKVGIETLAPVFVRSDHRIVDGIRLGRFVGSLKRWLENPDDLLEVGRDPPG